MRKMILFISVAALGLLALGSFTPVGQGQEHGAQTLTATLTGTVEVPGPGDADGSGTASVTLKHEEGQVCFEITVSNIQTPTAAHIHEGAAGQSGGVKVGFKAGEDGKWKGCVSAEKNLIHEIMQNPGNYYVNVHNAEFPNGAVRGQLAK